MTFELLAAAADAAPENSFGFLEAMEQGGFVAWFDPRRDGDHVGRFVLHPVHQAVRTAQGDERSTRPSARNFWKTGSACANGATKLDKNSAWRQLVDDAILAEDQHAKMTDKLEAHDWMHGSLAAFGRHDQLQARGRPVVPRNGRCNRSLRRPARYGYRYLPRPDQHRHRRFGFDRQGRRPRR